MIGCKNSIRASLFFALLSLAVPAASAHAQQNNPATDAAQPDANDVAAARNLLQVTRADQTFVAVFDMTIKKLTPLIMAANPQHQQQISDLMKTVFVPKIKEHVSDITDQIAMVYARNFTVQEMQQLTAFYQTPLGQKFLEKSISMMPEIMQATHPVVQSALKEALQDLATKMKQDNLQVPKEMGL